MENILLGVAVQAGSALIGTAIGTAIAVAVVRNQVGNLTSQFTRMSSKIDELPKDYVPRNEIQVALQGIRDIATHTRDMIQAFIYGSGGRATSLASLQAACDEQLEFSARGRALTEESEELKLEAYQDCDGVLTIGWGHTGPDVHVGMKITQEEAVAMLEHDVAWACATVHRLVRVNLNQNQFDALVDFIFNEGAPRFASSTLLRLLNQADYAGAARQFGVWVFGGGRRLDGLVTRRGREAALFLEAA